MGRKRKAYPDKFKIDAVREALHSGADRTEVAIKYNIAQSTLSEWITMFLEGPWGMMYFTAVIDLYSRKILSWRLSDSMKTDFCLECVKDAFEEYGVPAIFNTDCGSQYTSAAFVELLQSHNVEISMDGIGRCKDNIFVERTWRTLKYEWIFLRDYSSAEELRKSLGEFVKFFNSERIHQGLDYKTPDEVYDAGLITNRLKSKSMAA